MNFYSIYETREFTWKKDVLDSIAWYKREIDRMIKEERVYGYAEYAQAQKDIIKLINILKELSVDNKLTKSDRMTEYYAWQKLDQFEKVMNRVMGYTA